MRSTIAALLTALTLAMEVQANEPDTAMASKSTYLVLYRPGPAWPAGAPVSALPLRDHASYMLSLYKQGALKMAGPLTDNAGGAVVLEVQSETVAREIVLEDPAVKAGLFVYELHPWAPVNWEHRLNP